MKKRILFFIVSAFLLMHLSSCLKEEVLPAATQEGKNTFGCFLNGETWIPKGKIFDDVLDLSYDPTYKGGSFNIAAKRIGDDLDQVIVIGGTNVSGVGEYLFNPAEGAPGAFFINYITKCSYDDPEKNIVNGKFTITKLDVGNQIISGTFEFTLAKPGCDTIRVTEGRFDMKI